MKYIKAFSEIKKDDIAIAGGKGANLGEMTQAGIPVPPGVVLTADAYDCFMQENGIEPLKFEKAADIRSAILLAGIPAKIEEEIREFCKSLEAGARMAIRSSATAEDLDDASFADSRRLILT